jgi:hypothetical protein
VYWRARCWALAPRALRSASRIARAHVSGPAALGRMIPVSPTASGMPPRSVPTVGAPWSAASMITRGKASSTVDGTSRRWCLRCSGSMSYTRGTYVTFG